VKQTSIILMALLIGGCQAHQPANNPTTRPSLATTQPSYWLSMPATSSVDAADFNKLWDDCQKTAHHYGFVVDRLDQRKGDHDAAAGVEAVLRVLAAGRGDGG
jgi:hypothetical protein